MEIPTGADPSGMYAFRSFPMPDMPPLAHQLMGVLFLQVEAGVVRNSSIRTEFAGSEEQIEGTYDASSGEMSFHNSTSSADMPLSVSCTGYTRLDSAGNVVALHGSGQAAWLTGGHGPAAGGPQSGADPSSTSGSVVMRATSHLGEELSGFMWEAVPYVFYEQASVANQG